MQIIESLNPSSTSWVVAWTKSRCEKSLAEFLDRRNVTNFLPIVQKRSPRGSKFRVSNVPLFSGYVFYDSSAIERTEVFQSRKVADVLTPPDPQKLSQELENLQRALRVDPSMREVRFGMVGKPVQVTHGPMKGLEGEIVRLHSTTRLIVKISFLGKLAEMQIDEAFLKVAL